MTLHAVCVSAMQKISTTWGTSGTLIFGGIAYARFPQAQHAPRALRGGKLLAGARSLDLPESPTCPTCPTWWKSFGRCAVSWSSWKPYVPDVPYVVEIS